MLRWIVLFGIVCSAALAEDRPVMPGWLAGTWRLERPDGLVVEEHWRQPVGDVMLGVSQSSREGSTIEFEFLRIEFDREQQRLVYVALLSRQAETRFLGTSVDGVASLPEELRFENPDHDFPQTIRYLREGDNALRAVIAGPARDGGWRELEWRYGRVDD